MGDLLSSLSDSDSTRATAVADFFSGQITAVLGDGTDIQTLLRECMIEDDVLYAVFENTVIALLTEDTEMANAYTAASTALLPYALSPCMADLTTEELDGLTAEE